MWSRDAKTSEHAVGDAGDGEWNASTELERGREHARRCGAASADTASAADTAVESLFWRLRRLNVLNVQVHTFLLSSKVLGQTEVGMSDE